MTAIPLCLFLYWIASFASTSETSAPSSESARTCTQKCRCHAGGTSDYHKIINTWFQFTLWTLMKTWPLVGWPPVVELHGIRAYHLHHLHFSLYPQLIEEGGKVFLHLNAVVVHLGHRENAHFTFPPNLKSEWEWMKDVIIGSVSFFVCLEIPRLSRSLW